MAFPALFESQDAAPDFLRDHLVEIRNGAHKGKFRVDVTPTEGWGLEDVGALKSELATNRTGLRSLQGKLGEHDIDALIALHAQVEEMGGDLSQLKGAKDVEKLKAQLDAQHGEKVAALEGELSKLREQTRADLIQRAVTEAMDAAGVTRGRAVLQAYLQSRMSVVDGDNGPEVRVLDKSGAEMPSAQPGHLYATPSEFASGLKSDAEFGDFFDGNVQAGPGGNKPAGTRGTGYGAGSKQPVVISAEDARDHSRYAAARETATQEGRPLIVDGGGLAAADGNVAGHAG